jgi:hypothetical protein
MKRFFTSLVTFSLVETIGRHPAIAAGALTLLGVGGGAGIAMLTTPTITPFISSNFNPNSSIGNTGNGLKPNGGAVGALAMPTGNSTGGYTGSFALYGEATIDPNLGYNNGGVEVLFPGFALLDNTSPGQPMFTYQRTTNGSFPGSNFWQLPSLFPAQPQNATAGSNYAGGFYPFTASGGGCAREPVGVWFGSAISIVDPGFNCSTPPTFSAATVPNAGAQQTGITATCASGGLGMLVTTSVPVSPGLSPGLQYSLSGFTTTPTAGVLNTTFTATSVTGAGPYTVVGTAAGTCPGAIGSTGAFGSGLSGAYTFPGLSASNPFTGGTGITTKNGQHICFMLGEYGDDSPLPGAQFLSMVDEKGNPLPGSPALVQTPNMGTANFTAATTIGSATMNVSAMNPYTITSAAWSNGASGLPASLGVVTFQVSGNPGFVSGSQFQVTGMSPSSVNGTYAAVAGTNSTQVVGSQLTGPGGVPQAFANPGAITTASTPQMVSVIFPGMIALGSTAAGSIAPANSLILPYGTASTTGTGGVGTYQLGASQTAAISGAIFAYSSFYYSAVVSSNPAGGVATARIPSNAGDFVSLLGGSNPNSILPQRIGWGGALGNVAMLWGAVPSQIGGAPSTSDLASICTKTKDIQKYASDLGLKVQSLYRLNDLGIFGDSGNGTVTGYITNSDGTHATLNVVSTPYGSLALASGTETAKLTGPGLPVASPVTIPLTTSAVSTYAITPNTTAALGSIGSPVTFAVGAFAPAVPLQANTVKGYIDTTTGVSTLHVTSLDDGTTHSGFASGTGTLGTSWTSRIDDGGTANLNQGHVLTVTAPAGAPPSNAYIGVGTTVCPPVGSSAFPCAAVVSLGTGVGYAGTYNLDPAVAAQNITSQVMFGSGTIPGPATALQWTASVGTPAIGMVVADGGVSLTGSPLLVTGVSGTTPNFLLTVVGNYYPPISADATMQATLTTLVPGEYIQQSTAATPIVNPVKVLSYSGACGISGAYNGLLGCYALSGNPNASGTVGSSGSPVVFTGTTITDGGAIAPGPALTIRDPGPFITFPINLSTISCSALGSCTMSGALSLSGTYDIATLSGTPSGIQVLVSNSANGPPIAGCTPCNWGSLTGTISGGKWSGTIAGIPGGGPYIISVRAANGVGYATLPNSVKVGWVFALWGQGQSDSIQGTVAGSSISYFSGLWGYGWWNTAFSGSERYLQGPPITANFVLGQPVAYAGDRFGVTGGAGLSEAFGAFDQELTNAFGVPATFLSPTRDGVGLGPYTLGNVAQTQTVGAGDGSTLTWCSASKFCSHVDVGFPLVFNAASLTGGWFSGSVSGSTLTVTTRIGGAVSPGMVLSAGTGVSGAPTILRCLTGCAGLFPDGSTWQLSSSASSGATGTTSSPLRVDFSQASGLLPFGVTTTPWPNFNIQQSGAVVYSFAGFGTVLVKAGTFKITDTDPATGVPITICQDSQAFAYNNTGGNCTGANVASSFVNYQTGDYQITFTSGHAPLSGHAITASWASIITPDAIAPPFSRPQGLDFFGDSTGPQSGADAAMFSKAPGGINGHIYGGLGTDTTYIFNSAGGPNTGYQFGGIGYSQMVSFLYGVKFPALIPGASPSVPFLCGSQYRIEGPVEVFNSPGLAKDDEYDQWSQDTCTKSLLTGHITAAAGASTGTLTLDAATTFPMWEGEILGCVTVSGSCNVGPLSGAYITGLASGAWGAAASTYNIALAPVSAGVSTSASQPIQNPVFYSGQGPSYYAGALNDIIVSSQGLTGTTGRNPHISVGFSGGRRVTSRWAAMIYCHNGGNCDDPKLSRANDPTAGTPSPAFDYTNTFAAIATPTAVSGKVLTFNGLAAHARPIVLGHSVTCSGCSGSLVVIAVSNPPTQDTRAGQGQIGSANNGFTVTLGGSGTLPGGTPAYTFGCSPIGGSGGSNCINVDIALNVTGATAIDTCGANNLNGNAPNYVVPNGKCQGNGIGEIVRAFRAGTSQLMNGNVVGAVAGSPFDDGIDLASSQFNRSAAFTANIVGAKTVQLVKAPAYNPTTGVLVGVGQWASGLTYVSYGDLTVVSGRLASLLGYVGGQSFPFTPGSGYTNGIATQTATCSTIQGGGSPGAAPKFDVAVSGGAIISVVPAAATGATGLGIGSTCTVPLPAGGTGGAIPTIPLAPIEGQGGIGTYNTDSNTMGMFLYDNSGEPGNPLNSFFTNGQGGYFEPGLPLRPFGMFQGAAVSG